MFERSEPTKDAMIFATQDDGKDIEFDNLVDDQPETFDNNSDTMQANEPKTTIAKPPSRTAVAASTRAAGEARKPKPRKTRRSRLIQ